MKTNIEWADVTWNPVVGCSKVSPGCANCYAERMANRLAHNSLMPRYAYTIKDGRWSGQVVIAGDKVREPLSWKKPRRVFVNSMSDLFHDSVRDETIKVLFGIMEMCQQHTFMILTKRAERMAEVMRSIQPPPNVWLGVSVEDQQRADERMPYLLATPAAVRFVSCEPLLGPVDLLRSILGLDWVICGGETGPRARPMHASWARALRYQCNDARVPFFFKSWGEWGDGTSPWRVGKKAAGRLLDGREWNEYPEVHGDL